MARDNHFFLVVNSAGFGEIGVGLRIAHDVAQSGDGVIFLAPRDTGVLFRDTGFRHVAIDESLFDLKPLIASLARKEGCRSLALIDVTSVLMALDSLCVDVGFLEELGLPLVAVDFWNLREAGLEWDMGADTLPIPSLAGRIPRRLVSVPINKPTAEGAFEAFPAVCVATEEERALAREELGVPRDGKVVLFTSSRFQLAELQTRKHGQRLAGQLPVLAAEALARLGPHVHVIHVGPAAFAAWNVLGARYRWLGQVSAGRFPTLVAAADLLLSFNTTARTTISAIAAQLPIVSAVNSRAGRTTEEVVASLDQPPSESLRRWLDDVVPLYPFHVWGLGLYGFVSRILKDNPYTEAVRIVEILDEEALVGACHDLLFDSRARSRQMARLAAYRECARDLPSAGDAFRACL